MWGPVCCMTGEVCGALPAEAPRSGAREAPWRPHARACAKDVLASPHLLVCCRRAPPVRSTCETSEPWRPAAALRLSLCCWEVDAAAALACGAPV